MKYQLLVKRKDGKEVVIQTFEKNRLNHAKYFATKYGYTIKTIK